MRGSLREWLTEREEFFKGTVVEDAVAQLIGKPAKAA
jgi:hypothetical protein